MQKKTKAPNRQGFWVFGQGQAYFFAYDEFPWGISAAVSDMFQVEFPYRSQIDWPDDEEARIEPLPTIEPAVSVYQS
jgi:hypothetical protein